MRTRRTTMAIACLVLVLALAGCRIDGGTADPSSATPRSSSAGHSSQTRPPGTSPGRTSVGTATRPTGTRTAQRTGENSSASTARGPSSRPKPSTRSTSARSTSTRSTEPRFYVIAPTVTLPAEIGTEVSGLALGRGNPNVFYTIDDGTGTDAIAAVKSSGNVVAQIDADGMWSSNAEAITVAGCESGTCIYVGDIGDNNADRSDVTIYRMPEPPAGTTSVTEEAWTYYYPDGTHNAESLIIDDDRILIVTKPDKGVAAHRIYTGPAGGGELALAGTFRPPDPAQPGASLLVGTVATDASYDGHRVLLLTYDQVIEYRAPDDAADPADFPSWPHHELPMPDLEQAEGITGLADGCGYAVSSEAGPLSTNSTMAVVRCKR